MTKFKIHYYKPKKVILADLEKQNENENYQPFDIQGFQSYHPIYPTFFELNENNYDSVAFNHRYHVVDLHQVFDSQTSQIVERELFIKFAPLLDPVRYFIGRYKSQEGLNTLPKLSDNTDVHEKLSNPNNASYIDNFFCYLSSQLLNHHGYVHGVDYYGSFLGIQKKFKMNIADDIDYLLQSDYFNENKGKLYEVEQQESPFANFGSRTNKEKLCIHNGSNVSTFSLVELEGVDLLEEDEILDEKECVYEKESTVSSDDSNSELNYSDDEDSLIDASEEGEGEFDDSSSEGDGGEESVVEEEEGEVEEEEGEESEEEESEESEGEVPLNAYIYDFPVQMICMEKCTGTLDELFENQILDLDTAASALFQVIMILMAYQKAYAFTHNDLHTNNIMYIETKEEWLYYTVRGQHYKVPTYGKIFKIIDFGRAIYRFQGKIFCSDSFAPGGDAATQYNCEPYFNDNKPRLDPNYSFDLCRLGCALYDFLLDIDDENESGFTPDPLQKLIIDWVTDDNGKNVLYKKNGSERYPSFKLYKMIARTVHNKTPEDQLDKAYFAQYKTKQLDGVAMNLDALPSYI
jgi:hypothetical protein